jgi:lipopolysaccharide export LptBFGC system permease protein LptF
VLQLFESEGTKMDEIKNDRQLEQENRTDALKVTNSGMNIEEPSNQINMNERNEYREETAAEIAAPVSLNRNYDRNDMDKQTALGTGAGANVMGWSALAVSLISLFFMPVILGAAAIVLGVMARRRGADTLGAWSIGIGAVSVIIGIFVLPFF